MAGPHTERVGKFPSEPCTQRSVRIARQGRPQPGAKCAAGPYTELEGALTAGPCTGAAGTCVAGPCTGCVENLAPCNGQEVSARRGRTRNRPAYVRRSRAWNDGRRSRRGRVTDKREVCGWPAHGTGWQVPDGGVHSTRRDDCAARPYTYRGKSALRGRTRNWRVGSRRGHARRRPGRATRGCAWDVRRTWCRATGNRVVRGGAAHGTDPQMYDGTVHGTSGDAHGGAV